MNYKYKNGKYIICKDGIYFSLAPDQVTELADILKVIVAKEFPSDIKKGGYPDTCVLGDPHCDCKKGFRCERLAG